ncbi:MAG: NAD-dependent epimerase/dehydratase family protein [Methyloprofundus sp.]|nr:NAD-dependent epimerase/dehydratase family protein [Methyloprofundus sp.]
MVNIHIRPRLIIFVHDLLMVAVAWLGAYWLRFNLDTIPDFYFNTAVSLLPLVIFCQALVFCYFGLYRGVWRFSSVPDFIRIAKSVFAGVFIIAVSLFLFNRLYGVPRAVIPLYAFLILFLLCVPRFVYRLWKERVLHERTGGKRVLIVGAGSAGEMLVRDLLTHDGAEFLPYAFVDDDINKQKREIRGLPVIGGIKQIPSLIESLQIEMIFIAIPSASDTQMRRVVEICEQCAIGFQTLPSVKELLSGSVTQVNLRDVSIEDILGRDPVHLDWQAIRNSMSDKCVLVTGGGGSIGSELCKQIATVSPKNLIVYDQSEFNLYQINGQLAKLFPDLNYRVILGDVTNPLSVAKVFDSFHPDVIFHAAAYKHVPMLENQVREAVYNNVIGTKILADAAIAANVQRFVLISTDKAVNPANVMGATKRAAEILCQNLNQAHGTHFITVRFGNVLDSAGSVIPLFREQIKAGGPVTVTHPDITRYFMTIPEACLLIMQAETIGQGGEIFVLDMGEPIKISYLAEQMIKLSGKQAEKDITIKYVGLRPGEKLYEELFYEQEPLLNTAYDKLFQAKARVYDQQEWTAHINELVYTCNQPGMEGQLAILKKLVPEFKGEHVELNE